MVTDAQKTLQGIYMREKYLYKTFWSLREGRVFALGGVFQGTSSITETYLQPENQRTRGSTFTAVESGCGGF